MNRKEFLELFDAQSTVHVVFGDHSWSIRKSYGGIWEGIRAALLKSWDDDDDKAEAA
jgi:hypothetical protein